jgi:hypothetical protein
MPARTNLFGRSLLMVLAITAAVYPSFAIARCHGPGATKSCCNRSTAHGTDSQRRQDDHSNRLPEQQCAGTSVCCQMPLMVYSPPMVASGNVQGIPLLMSSDLFTGRIEMDSIFHPPRIA